jgi:hypothetical protein
MDITEAAQSACCLAALAGAENSILVLEGYSSGQAERQDHNVCDDQTPAPSANDSLPSKNLAAPERQMSSLESFSISKADAGLDIDMRGCTHGEVSVHVVQTLLT